MADVTAVIEDRDVWGSHQVRWATVTFTAGYTNAGETVTPALFNLSEIKNLIPSNPSLDDDTMVSVTYDDATKTLFLVDELGVLQGTVDMSATTCQVLVIGK